MSSSGQVELTPTGAGWRTVSFLLDPSMLDLFSGSQQLRLTIALNTQSGAPAILLDNLRFGGAVDPELRYDFEPGVEGWTNIGGAATGTSTTGQPTFSSNRSLELSIDGSSDASVWVVPADSPAPEDTITYHVWIPAGAPIRAISPFMLDDDWDWTDVWIDNPETGTWLTLTVEVLEDATLPLRQVGVKLYLDNGSSYNGSIYLDAIDW